MFLPSHSQMFFRSNRPELFCKKAILRDFLKFTRKQLFQSFFIIKVAGQGWQLYLKRDPVSWCFLWVLRNLEEHLFSFLTEHLWWLLLVLQNRCSYKFPDIHQKISLLKSLFNIVRDLKGRNFNKKETPAQVFSCEYHKILKNSYFIEHPQWLLLHMVAEFLRISNSS